METGSRAHDGMVQSPSVGALCLYLVETHRAAWSENAECKSLISIGHAWNRMWSGPHATAGAEDKSQIRSLPLRLYGPPWLIHSHQDNEYAVYLAEMVFPCAIKSSCGPFSKQHRETLRGIWVFSAPKKCGVLILHRALFPKKLLKWVQT